jgi:acyl-CoA thioester hydrolase
VIELALRIDWSDLDVFGHVNSLSFLRYVQAARVHYWERIGLYQSFLADRRGPVLASVRCDFRKPLFYPGLVTLRTQTAFIRTTSFGFAHTLVDQVGDVAAEASDVMVMFDYVGHQKLPFPTVFRDRIAALEPHPASRGE